MATYYKLKDGTTQQIRKDLSGQRFGMLTVIEPCGTTGSGTIWKCECDCGNIITRTSSNLLHATTKLPKNCGCYTQAMKPHNKGTRLHNIWNNMKDRCRNKNSPVYYRYGGRSITVCKEWNDSFESFKAWAMSHGYADELTIDRIDNNKGYSPENCRWTDMKTQCNNTGRNHYITWRGETHTLTEWSRILGVSYGTLKSRIFKDGKTDIEALEMEERKTKIIYLDHASTTSALPYAIKRHNEVLRETPYNPSSEHQCGMKARNRLDNARERIARCISAPPESIFFTSGATESCQWAMQTLFEQCASVFVSAVEHHAVLERKRVRDSTILPNFQSGCAQMLGQNEVGTIFDVKHLYGKYNLVFTDATAAVGHIPVDVSGIDLMAFSGHKFGGVPGAGVLYAKDPSILSPLIRGGGQERGMRSGTENVPAICALAAALEWQTEHMEENTAKLSNLFEILRTELTKIPGVLWNTPFDRPHLPHILNVSFTGVDAHALALLLSKDGVMVSPGGAACSSGKHEPSHVLMAMFHDERRSRSAIRISLSHENTQEECVEAAKKIEEAVGYLRGL